MSAITLEVQTITHFHYGTLTGGFQENVWQHPLDDNEVNVPKLLTTHHLPVFIDLSETPEGTLLNFGNLKDYTCHFFDQNRNWLDTLSPINDKTIGGYFLTNASYALICSHKLENCNRGISTYEVVSFSILEPVVNTAKNFMPYYGQFPYFIIKHERTPCLFTQVPIVINPKEKDTPGVKITINEEKRSVREHYHHVLFETGKRFYEDTKTNYGEAKPVCLVIHEKLACYFSENEAPEWSRHIPANGTLMDVNGCIIFKNRPHFYNIDKPAVF